jgi:hypothetical protein
MIDGIVLGLVLLVAIGAIIVTISTWKTHDSSMRPSCGTKGSRTETKGSIIEIIHRNDV